MSNLKRFLAMTLVMLTMISAIATTVSAKTFEDVQVLKNAELTAAIDILSELGIVKGVSEGNFDPDTPVTRQQMALFIARIHSATPEYFVASSAEKDKPNFKDVSDPTYFTAINYCFEHQIINGRVAPSEEGAKNGEFDPTGTIIFQDGVKMMVSALGYTGLSYPVGYLSKAKEIGLLDGFNLSAMKAGEELKRSDIAAMLYNYFLNDYVVVENIYNAIGKNYVSTKIRKPVCEKFGITKIEGYVTAIEGAAIPLTVEDPYAEVGSGDTVSFNSSAISMKTANTTAASGYNLVISYAVPEVVTSPTEYTVDFDNGKGTIYVVPATSTRASAELRTTKKALGVDADYPGLVGSWDLLGCKIITYVNTTNKKISLATEVIGTKHTVSDMSVDITDWDKDTNRYTKDSSIKSFTFDKEIYTQYNAAEYTSASVNYKYQGDINWATGYVFLGRGASKAVHVDMNNTPTATSVSANNIWYLAGMIAVDAALKVDVVDNGLNKDGTPNRAVIFTPQEAVYIDTESAKDNFTYVRGDGTTKTVRRDAGVQRFIGLNSFEDIKYDGYNAYYICDLGEFVLRGDKLTELGTATVSGTTKTTVNLTYSVASISAGNISINYNNGETFYRALGNRRADTTLATTDSVANSSYMTGYWEYNKEDENDTGTKVEGQWTAGTSNAYPIAQYDVYKVFSYKSGVSLNTKDAGAFLLIRDKVAKVNANRRYGYVVSETGNYQMLSNGQNAVMYIVYNLDTRLQETVYDTRPLSTTPYRKGALIVYETVGFNVPNTHQILGSIDPLSANFLNKTRTVSMLPMSKTGRMFASLGGGSTFTTEKTPEDDNTIMITDDMPSYIPEIRVTSTATTTTTTPVGKVSAVGYHKNGTATFAPISNSTLKAGVLTIPAQAGTNNLYAIDLAGFLGYAKYNYPIVPSLGDIIGNVKNTIGENVATAFATADFKTNFRYTVKKGNISTTYGAYLFWDYTTGTAQTEDPDASEGNLWISNIDGKIYCDSSANERDAQKTVAQSEMLYGGIATTGMYITPSETSAWIYVKDGITDLTFIGANGEIYTLTVIVGSDAGSDTVIADIIQKEINDEGSTITNKDLGVVISAADANNSNKIISEIKADLEEWLTDRVQNAFGAGYKAKITKIINKYTGLGQTFAALDPKAVLAAVSSNSTLSLVIDYSVVLTNNTPVATGLTATLDLEVETGSSESTVTETTYGSSNLNRFTQYNFLTGTETGWVTTDTTVGIWGKGFILVGNTVEVSDPATISTGSATGYLGSSSIVCIYDVNNLNKVNAISASDLRTLLDYGKDGVGANIQKFIKSALIVSDAGYVKVLYLGIDPTALLAANESVVNNYFFSSSSAIGTKYYTIKAFTSETFVSNTAYTLASVNEDKNVLLAVPTVDVNRYVFIGSYVRATSTMTTNPVTNKSYYVADLVSSSSVLNFNTVENLNAVVNAGFRVNYRSGTTYYVATDVYTNITSNTSVNYVQIKVTTNSANTILTSTSSINIYQNIESLGLYNFTSGYPQPTAGVYGWYLIPNKYLSNYPSNATGYTVLEITW